jgi:hypothetical protein
MPHYIHRATASRPFSRIYPPLLQFRAYFPRVGLRLRTGDKPRTPPPASPGRRTGGGAYRPAARPPFPHILQHTVTFIRTMKHRGEPIVVSPPSAASSHHAQRTSVAVRRRPLLSLPLAAGLPPLESKKGGVCSLQSFRSASLLPVANPSFHGSKGEGQPPARGRGPGGRKKRKRPCLRFFRSERRPAAPAAALPQRGVLCPPGFLSSHHA